MDLVVCNKHVSIWYYFIIHTLHSCLSCANTSYSCVSTVYVLQVLGLLIVAGSWSQVMLQLSWLPLGGVWALSFLIHITICTRSSSCSQLVCGRRPVLLLFTAGIFASLCSAGVAVIVGITTRMSQYTNLHIVWTSKVNSVFCDFQ